MADEKDLGLPSREEIQKVLFRTYLATIRQWLKQLEEGQVEVTQEIAIESGKLLIELYSILFSTDQK